jgi:two-component system, NtrC family, response regulator HupR/HoxA
MAGGEAGKSRVLIVDDEPAALTSLEALLEEEFEVISAGGAEEATRALLAGRIDVVVTDYQMPGRSGLELLEWVGRLSPAPAGILLTGQGGLPEVKSARQIPHVFMVLHKNYRPEFIAGWIRNAAVYARMQQKGPARK